MDNIPEYQFSSFTNKKLFQLGLKKSSFINNPIPTGKEIVIDSNTFLNNISNKSICVENGAALICENFINTTIEGKPKSKIFITGQFKGEIHSKGTVELGLKSFFAGSIQCGKLIVQNNKNNTSENPSIEGEIRIEKK